METMPDADLGQSEAVKPVTFLLRVSPLLLVPALSSWPVPDDHLPERCTAISKFSSATCMNAFPSHWKFPELPPNSLRTLFSKLSAVSIELKKSLLEPDA